MRLENWPSILAKEIDSAKDSPFVWGVEDCLKFPLNVAGKFLDYCPKAKIGEEKFPYATEEESVEVLKANFGGTMDGVFDRVFARIPPKTAGRGDIIIVDFKGAEICAIIDTSGRMAAGKAMTGVLFVPVSKAIKAWKVE